MPPPLLASALGSRRLNNPQDFVRLEVEAALRRDIPLIPVLVSGATMPRPEDLPASLEGLAWRHAAIAPGVTPPGGTPGSPG